MCSPGERLRQLFGNEFQVKALLIRMAFDAAEPLGERLGIAVLATGTNLGAAANWVPGSVSPFDLGI
jgi:hypothetical protein